jgi:hypothetical protein
MLAPLGASNEKPPLQARAFSVPKCDAKWWEYVTCNNMVLIINRFESVEEISLRSEEN